MVDLESSGGIYTHFQHLTHATFHPMRSERVSRRGLVVVSIVSGKTDLHIKTMVKTIS